MEQTKNFKYWKKNWIGNWAGKRFNQNNCTTKINWYFIRKVGYSFNIIEVEAWYYMKNKYHFPKISNLHCANIVIKQLPSIEKQHQITLFSPWLSFDHQVIIFQRRRFTHQDKNRVSLFFQYFSIIFTSWDYSSFLLFQKSNRFWNLLYIRFCY